MTQIADRPARPDETLAVAVSDITQSLTMVQAINRALYDAMAATSGYWCLARMSRSRVGCFG